MTKEELADLRKSMWIGNAWVHADEVNRLLDHIDAQAARIEKMRARFKEAWRSTTNSNYPEGAADEFASIMLDAFEADDELAKE